MSDANGRSPMHEGTKQDILEDIAETEADDSFGTYEFVFAPPVDESYAFWERQEMGLDREVMEPSPALANALHIFAEAGCKVGYGDTVEFAFSLNRCWYFAKCNRCIRSLGYALPVISDIDALAQLVDDVAKGRILMFVLKEGK